MDETWLYHYDPETKQQSMEGCLASHPAPNILAPIFFDQDGILLIDYLPKG
jgi:hypothetical protein